MNACHQTILRKTAVVLLSCTALPSTHAQSGNSAASPTDAANLTQQTLHLSATTSSAEFQDTFVALRNLLRANATVIPLAGQNMVTINATPNQLKLAQKILDDLQPRQPTPSHNRPALLQHANAVALPRP